MDIRIKKKEDIAGFAVGSVGPVLCLRETRNGKYRYG